MPIKKKSPSKSATTKNEQFDFLLRHVYLTMNIKKFHLTILIQIESLSSQIEYDFNVRPFYMDDATVEIELIHHRRIMSLSWICLNRWNQIDYF